MNEVPFFANTVDDIHCVQACFKIILKYFLPDRDFSYLQLDRMSQRQPRKGTWWPPMLLELQKLGLKVKCIEGFNYQAFYRQGEEYVRQIYPEPTLRYYLQDSNLMDIKGLIPNFLKKVDVKDRPATLQDLRALLENGWLVAVDLNAAVLNDLKTADYVGHMVVVVAIDQNNIWLHDPGLPPRPNRKISLHKFTKAWFWAGEKNAGLVAVKST
jgi:hypothetical protein